MKASVLLGLLVGSLVAVPDSAAESPSPNLIFIMADDLGLGEIGCYGSRVLRTPNIDRLAAEGMRFNRAYSGSAVCAPTRCVLMTGLHTGHAAVRANRGRTGRVALAPEEVTVAEKMKEAGYATGGFGKWGLGNPGTTGVPEKQGYDVFYGYYDQQHAHSYFPTFLLRNSEEIKLAGNKPAGTKLGKGEGTEYAVDLIMAEMFKFIEANKSRPFFCYATWTLPHGDYEVPGIAPEFADKPWAENVRKHATMIRRLDDDVGRVMAKLKELGLDDNTLVIFTSDNGADGPGRATFEGTGGLRGWKRHLHEGGIRAPFIARWPGRVKAGGTSDVLTSHVDWMATACELAGVSAPRTDGISIVPTLFGRPQAATHDHLYWETYEGPAPFQQAVRMGDWKGYRTALKGPLELYDLFKDPNESANLASMNPDVVKKIEALMAAQHVADANWTPTETPAVPPGARAARAVNWPAWRGPTADGVCTEVGLPVRWNTTNNIRWRVALPGPGNSTPVVWGNRIFLTQAEGDQRTLMCFHRADGRLLWRKGVKTREPEPTHPTNPYCPGSPVTDGERVIASFASDGLFCYDLAGNELWRRDDLGRQIHIWGGGSSPVIHGDACFLNFGPGETTYLLAVNKRTGKTLWKQDEETGYGKPPTADVSGGGKGPATYIGSWTTPAILRVEGSDQLLMSWPRRLASYDPDSGRELWSCAGLNPLCYTSPIASGDLVVTMGGFNGNAMAVRAGGSGDITERRRLWRVERTKQRIGSGVIHDGHIYIHNDPGIAECIELATGKIVWEERLRATGGTGQNWSSILLADGLCYSITQGGDCFVFKASPKFEVVSVNSLGERSNSSIAPSAGRLYIRTHQALWCVEKNAAATTATVTPAAPAATTATTVDVASRGYFPPSESQGGWRGVKTDDEIATVGGMDARKLAELREWLLKSDDRPFAAVVIRRGTVVLQVERGNSAASDARRVASVSKAICATVLAIASERSQQGKTPRKMTFDDKAFEFIPWALPLSDARKADITVKQLLNHTSGLCPEATGAPNDGKWEYILGHTGDARTAKLAFDPGTGCGYSTHGLAHAALVCETVTGKPYDQFAIEALFEPLGIEKWWFQYYDGGGKIGRHPSHGLGMPARDLARIGYCMLRGGRWGDTQVIPKWFVEQTAAPTHAVKTPEMRWKLNPEVFSHAWELPARHSPDSGKHIAGIPADARYKPGSGGQLLAFVPSLDLVIARQTGSSGQWDYEEYLRRACDAVLASTNEKH